MPPPVLADSDDDGDDIVVGADDEAGGVLRSSGNNCTSTEEAAANGDYDGTNEKSTGSTERLRRQIQSAERGLLSTDSAQLAMNQPSSAISPSMQANKRRHTSVSGSQGSASPEKRVKRTKTLKTYGAEGRACGADEGSFDHLRDDATATSHSVRFTEHSGVDSSAALPPGSVQTDFVNHEPSVLFRDSGSTVADSSSAQKRLVEQALRGKKGLSTSAVNCGDSDDQQKSSSFPWSVSEQTRSAHSNGNGNLQPANGDETAGGGAVKSKQPVDEEQAAKLADETVDRLNTETPLKPRLSSAVEISQPEHEITAQALEARKSSRRASKGRKREIVPDDTDPLNPEDASIGLPKELYQPRPSRRRATDIAEEHIDFSVRPERAAKVKRTKTTHASSGFAAVEAERGGPLDANAIAQISGSRRVKGRATREALQADKTQADESDRSQVLDGHAGIGAEENSALTDLGPSPATDVLPQDKQRTEGKIFVKPSIPSPKKKPVSRSKRSHTTIFEDHVEFTGSQRSPSLSQQQAKRKSALQDVQNEAVEKSKRKRRTIITDEDDEEHELADDVDVKPAEKEDLSTLKKRGRGRPPKATAKSQVKSADKVLEDSEEEDSDQSEIDEPPKKRGRGRPSKAVSESQANPVPERETDDSFDAPKLDQSLQKSAEDVAETLSEVQKGNAGAPKTSQTVRNIPTPSPEKPDTQPAATPQKASKPSPSSHSPIKNSSKVPLRVGLSRRRRIPSLLKVMKPSKR